MRKQITKTIFTLALIISPFVINTTLADGPGPPPATRINGDQPIGGGAPLDGGLSILLLLGAGYGAKRVASFRKKD